VGERKGKQGKRRVKGRDESSQLIGSEHLSFVTGHAARPREEKKWAASRGLESECQGVSQEQGGRHEELE